MESPVNTQPKEFLQVSGSVLSGFRSGHNTVTAALLALNYIVKALDNQKHCVALFIDLSKAFDTWSIGSTK